MGIGATPGGISCTKQYNTDCRIIQGEGHLARLTCRGAPAVKMSAHGVGKAPDGQGARPASGQAHWLPYASPFLPSIRDQIANS